MVHELIAQVIVIIVVAIVAAKVGRRFGIPEIIPLLLAGYLLGADVLNILRPEELGINLESLALVAVPIVLFYDGIKTDPNSLGGSWKTIVSINTVAVGVTVAGIAVVCASFLGFSWTSSFLLGAILSSTDPASILPILRRLNISKKISSILEAETAFNDAAAIALFLIGLSVAAGAVFSFQAVAFQFLFLVVASVLVGIVVGLASNFLLTRFRIEKDLVFATIVVLFAAFLTAEYFSASGVIASVVAAMVFGVYLRSKHVDSINRLNTISVWENLNFFAIALIFLILGSEMRLEVLAPFLWVGVAIALAFLFLVRPITILLSTWFDKSFSFKEKLFVSWVGSPRGTVSAALAAIVLSRASQGLFHAGEAQAIFGITLIVIAITVVITSFTSWFAAHSLLKIKENAAQERYRLLKTELKAMMIAARKLREDWKTGFVNTKLYEEISEKHKEIVDSIEKEIEKLISKNPALAHKDRVEKVRELLAVQVNALEEAFNNKELSERGYRELMEKYSTLLGRLAEIEGEE